MGAKYKANGQLQEVGLAGMLSLLTAVLLHTTTCCPPSATEPDYHALPHDFVAVAQAVFRSGPTPSVFVNLCTSPFFVHQAWLAGMCMEFVASGTRVSVL